MKYQKNILVFLSNANMTRGATRSFIDLLPILLNNFNVYIVGPKKDNAFDSALSEIFQGKYLELDKLCYTAVKINQVKHIKNKIKKLLYPIRVHSKIRKISKYFNVEFDLVYSNAITVQLGVEYAKYFKIPHIWHVREFLQEDLKMDYYNHNYIYNKLFAYSNAIFITNAISDKFNQYFKGNTTVIHNFVKFNYIEKKYSNQFVFAIVGSVSESKGQRYAIEAFNILLKSYPECKLLIIGKGDDFEYCKDLVAKYAIGDKVEFLGQRNDVNQILSNVNVQLVCSRFEAMGRVTVEGMLSKTLVIGADTAGTKELIGDNYGLLYKQGNTQDLCKKMIYSIEHKTECEKIVEDAYKYAIKEFSYENYEEKLINFFESVLNKV